MLMAMFQRNAGTDVVVDAALCAALHNNKALAAVLDVAEGSIARMKAGNDAGPGIARLGFCGRAWWVSFLTRMGEHFGLLVIEHEELAALVQNQRRMLKMELSGHAAERECA